MAEWSNAAVLKTVVPQGTGGSNPSFSAQRKLKNPQKSAKPLKTLMFLRVFCFFYFSEKRKIHLKKHTWVTLFVDLVKIGRQKIGKGS